jgi:phenylpyruvate tautomerase PptA (4-oxalocrotonate tautomerase family)
VVNTDLAQSTAVVARATDVIVRPSLRTGTAAIVVVVVVRRAQAWIFEERLVAAPQREG